MTPLLVCYRYSGSMAYDREVIWAYVERSGGHASIKIDHIDFWLPLRAETFLVLAWPDLQRHPELDLI